MTKKKKSRYNPLKFLLTFAICMGLLAGLQALCHFDVAPYSAPRTTAQPPTPPTPNPVVHPGSIKPFITPAPLSDTAIAHQDSLPTTPAEGSSTSAAYSIRRGSRLTTYNECFPDSQSVQLEAAIRNGISPAATRDEFMQMVRQYQLVDISHSPFYVVDDLTHSIPYLVPRAQALLNTIALNFIDSLLSKGMEPHLPIVSSVLRSTEDVARLQHGNQNATTNSCHCYGTTIDIAYHRFVPLHPSLIGSDSITRWNDDLKFVLAEVLYDLRQQGRCYVKYEQHQACFHLTVR